MNRSPVSIMFGLRKVRPPLTTYQRVNLELLMRRTIEVVGIGQVRQQVVITDLTELHLDHSEPQRLIRSVRDALCQRMPAVDPFEIVIEEPAKMDFPATYQAANQTTADQTAADQKAFAQVTANPSTAILRVASDLLVDPLRTTMELAYQYSNHFWHTRPEATEVDKDPKTTNLMPVCCGLGVLASDACLYDQQWSQAGWSGWSMSRSGYYNAVELGYAMALLARARGEVDPPWNDALRLDARATVSEANRYFEQHERGGGCLLFDAGKIPTRACDDVQLANWLCGTDPAFALASGHALVGRDDLSPRVIQASIEASRSRDVHLVATAARLLGGANRNDSNAKGRVRELVGYKSPAVSLSALQAAVDLGIPLREFAARILKLLDQLSADSFALIELIGGEGTDCSVLGPKICEQIARSIRLDDHELTQAMLECLSRIVEDPASCLTKRIRSPEIRTRAIERLAKVG